MQEIDPGTLQRLVDAASRSREQAYAPYSHFQVGAALLASDGEIVTGCNVENASFSLTLCAERVAAAGAVARGQRDWRVMALVTKGGVTPCGACRQFLAEFGNDLLVVCVDTERGGSRKGYRLSELLPESFDASSLPPQPPPAG